MSVTDGRLRTALADHYQLERELGAGGMATVYLAHDLKHDRQVAIKVLRPELAAVIGADRFLSEIKTTANLQHPHILPLHDSGEADSFLYYVMPLMEGETLRDRITREKQLPISDAVRIARECAAALDYAHRKGIVHRDIKPENILLHDGSALVADFGIALAASKAGETRMTQTGMSLGTPHYMSPEQAMGEREITQRSDVYALGCVLYEMLTGEPPFTGSTAQAIVARVVTESPRPMLPQRHTIPPHVEAAVLTALEKLPADRFATAAEFADALENKGGTYAATVQLASRPHVLTSSRPGRALALAAVSALLAATATWALTRQGKAGAPVTRYGLAFADGQAPLGRIAITPDGSRLVYQGPGDSGQRRQFWVKRRDEYQATPLPGTSNAAGPYISPDGEWIAFAQDFQLKKMPISGGAITTLADSANGGGGMAWLDDGTLVYVQRGTWALMRVSEAGGPSTLLRAPDQGRGLLFPAALPRGRGVLFTSCTPSCEASDLWVFELESGDARVVIPGAGMGAYLASGHLAYVARDGQIFAAPFELKALEIRGTPVPVQSGVAMANNFGPNLTVSSTGTLVMEVGGPTAGASAERHTLVWVDRAGAQRPVDSAWTFRLGQRAGNAGWALSPDGKRLAIGLDTESGDDIWIKELPAGPLSRMTFDTTDDSRPRWTLDGRSVMYTVRRPELRQQRADGTGDTEIVLNRASIITEALTINEALWSPDGRWLVFRRGGAVGAAGGRDIFGIRPGVDSASVPLVAKPGVDESAPALSPDGRWLAYESDETGRSEVYVRPFPGTDSGKWQVSTNGGQAPLWAHSGRELFFVDAERNMVVALVQGGAEFQLGARRILFNLGEDLYLNSRENYTPFDLSRDDQRFIMARVVRRAADRERTFVLVENWFEELKGKVKR